MGSPIKGPVKKKNTFPTENLGFRLTFTNGFEPTALLLLILFSTPVTSFVVYPGSENIDPLTVTHQDQGVLFSNWMKMQPLAH